MKIDILRRKIAGFIRQTWRLPQRIANTVRWYREQNVRAQTEAERLDRIRNPLKYLGK